MSPFFWLILMIIFLLVEIFTPGTFFMIWFAFGALVTLIVSIFTENLLIQGISFLVVTAASLIVFYPAMRRYLAGKSKSSNVDELINEEGIVIEEINPQKGRGLVKVKGEVWKAEAKENIPKDSVVKILKVEGAHLVVEKK